VANSICGSLASILTHSAGRQTTVRFQSVEIQPSKRDPGRARRSFPRFLPGAAQGSLVIPAGSVQSMELVGWDDPAGTADVSNLNASNKPA